MLINNKALQHAGGHSRITLPASQANRQIDSNHASYIPGPTVVLGLQRLKNQVLQVSQLFGTTVVINQEPSLKLDWWSTRTNLLTGEEDPASGAQYSHRNGCLDAGVKTGGFWSTDREKRPHKLPGTPCSRLRDEVIYQRQKKCSHSAEDGQQDCRLLCESDERNSLPTVEQPGNSPLAIAPGKELTSISGAPTKNGQLQYMADEESRTIQSTVEWQLHQQAYHASLWYVQRGPFCNMSRHSAGEICELATRPRSDRVRSTTTDLDQPEGVCFSPDLEMSQVSEGGQSIAGTDSISVEIPAMVSSTAEAIKRLSLVLPQTHYF